MHVNVKFKLSCTIFTAAPDMVGNAIIDLNTVYVDNNNVSFTLNWTEPFANFDPIVNYTITISCSDVHCPVVFTVTTTSTSVNFITDLSMMTPLSVTAIVILLVHQILQY